MDTPPFAERARVRLRHEIREQLLTVFAERGCFATRVDDVTAAVGIGKGSLYNLFESRELLFRDGCQLGLDGLMAHCSRVIAEASTDPDHGIRRVVCEFLTLNNQRTPVSPDAVGRLACCNVWMGATARPLSVVEAIAPVVRLWQTAGAIGSDDPTWVAQVLIGLVHVPPGAQAVTDPALLAEAANRVVTVLLRAFPPALRDPA